MFVSENETGNEIMRAGSSPGTGTLSWWRGLCVAVIPEAMLFRAIPTTPMRGRSRDEFTLPGKGLSGS